MLTISLNGYEMFAPPSQERTLMDEVFNLYGDLKARGEIISFGIKTEDRAAYKRMAHGLQDMLLEESNFRLVKATGSFPRVTNMPRFLEDFYHDDMKGAPDATRRQ